MFGGDAEVCIDSEEVLQPFFLCEPPEQVRLFIFLYCISVAAGIAMHHRAAARFYRWFVKAEEVPAAKVRGLAYNACQAYGIFPVPKLSFEAFQLSGLLLVTSLLLACHSGLAPRFFLFTSFALYFLYFGQLFCESKHGGHGSLLVPSVLLLLAMSGGPQSTPWSLGFIKIFVGVIYFAGAISKLLVSALFGMPWLGSTMQAYLWDGMWARPHPRPAARSFQRFVVTRWWACTGMAMSGLIFELAFLPLVLFGGHIGGAAAGMVALAFHLGVDLLQGLDFKPFWCPVLWVFVPEIQALLTGRSPAPEELWTAVMAQGFGEAPCRWIFSAMYVAFEVIASLGMFDVTGKESLPMTCCPMFAAPRNIFGDEFRAAFLTDADLRRGGSIDTAYSYSPFNEVMRIEERGLKQLPARVMYWMVSNHHAPLVEPLLNKELLDKDLTFFSNFELSPELKSRVAHVASLLDSAKPADWADCAKVQEVLALQDECQRLFHEDARRSRDAEREVAQPEESESDLSLVASLSRLLLLPLAAKA